MKKKEVIEYFGSISATARALRISPSAVTQWPENIPDRIGFKIELVTRGYFKTNETYNNQAIL